MKRVKLKVLGISYSQTQSGAYALVLVEEKGERRIPIIIGGFEAQSIVIKLENLNPPRPLTHDLIKNFADSFGITLFEVLIDRLEDGVFYSKLICSDGEREISIDSRTSDAVALALRFSCPIFTTEDIIERAGIVINQGEEQRQPESDEETIVADSADDYGALSEEDLEKMMDEAVADEDYERAATLKKELDRRQKKK
ncbi:MAG: bifunctional nuclease family protein [Bacteroidales bacterium]|jgi:bifunctional DNase/RNase|nr:bifunctional nuclease family protein [Bacteroidales bacterium]